MEQIERFAASLTAEGRYRLLVDAIADYAVYMLDIDGIISSWNTGARRFKGYEAEEILGQHFSVFYTPEDAKAGIPQYALHTARTTGKFEAEGWRVRKDGTHFWAYVIIDPIYDDNGDLVGFAKVTRDLTERKEAERKLLAAREALFQSQKMEAVGQLTGGIAHDFNNLLMVVLASLDMLRRKMPQDEKLLALLDNALQGAQRGASLTQRMLAFARRQQLDYQAIDVRELVTGMADMLQRALGTEIQIETHFPLKLSLVRTDVNQLEGALLNLAVNARDAMPKETGKIIISAREVSVPSDSPDGMKPGAYVCLSVQDNGSGMDAETISRATEPFYTTKGAGKGTGLGLSMVHGLAQQSGGTLKVTSALGVGTTIDLWFPAAAVAEPEETEETRAEQPVARLAPMHFLVVDDDALVLTNTVAMLEDENHKVTTASSAMQALEILCKRNDIDMLITDQAMPNMTGLQLAETVSAQWPDLPILLASGYVEIQQSVGQNVPTLMKPFSQAQLIESIGKLYNAKKQKP